MPISSLEPLDRFVAETLKRLFGGEFDDPIREALRALDSRVPTAAQLLDGHEDLQAIRDELRMLTQGGAPRNPVLEAAQAQADGSQVQLGSFDDSDDDDACGEANGGPGEVASGSAFQVRAKYVSKCQIKRSETMQTHVLAGNASNNNN